MYGEILDFFINCLAEESKEMISIKGEISDKLHILKNVDVEDVKNFLLSKGNYETSNIFEFEVYREFEKFYRKKKTKYYQENFYLGLEYLKNEKGIIYPLYFAEVDLDMDSEIGVISIVDYELRFNFSVLDRDLTQEEKKGIADDIESVLDWSSKVSIFKGNIDEKLLEKIEEKPFLFIASVPKFYIWATEELEDIKKEYISSIDKTSLKYFISQSSITPFEKPQKYIEVFELNREQEKAVRKALSNPFTVITGPPGTGKTQVVLNILINLSFNNKKVLFASKNNKAVNTVLEKLEKMNFYYLPFIRLGNKREKDKGKEKILNSIKRPNREIVEKTNYSEIEKIKREIDKIYENFDNSLKFFHRLYEKIKKYEEKVMEVEEFKFSFKSNDEIFKILDCISQPNSETVGTYRKFLGDVKEFFIFFEKFKEKFVKCNEYQQKLNRDLIYILKDEGHISLSEEEYTYLKELKLSLKGWIEGKVNLFNKILERVFPSFYRKKYFNKYQMVFQNQRSSIRNYFLKTLKEFTFSEYYKYLSIFEDLLYYSEEKRNLEFIREQLINEKYRRLYEYICKIAPQLKEKFKNAFSDRDEENILLLLESEANKLKVVKSYFEMQVSNFEGLEEIERKFKELSSSNDTKQLEDRLKFLKDQLLKRSFHIFQEHLIEKIQENKAMLSQIVENYYSKWRDNELYLLFLKLKSFLGIWVTTNLSTRYNIPNHPAIFDYVVIDEASQNDIATVIPLLFRAKNAVIIGDPNQLKHITNLKENTIYKIAEKAGLDRSKLIYFNYLKFSAFDLAKIRYIEATKNEPIQLKIHYRSHKDIINFANTIVKDYKLYPKKYIKSRVESAKIPIGIHWIDVKGYYRENNTNIQEVKAIISFLEERRELLKNISLGIITPFSNQAKLIAEELIKRKLDNIDVNKNITSSTVHRFQGDERDVILYSSVMSKEILKKKRTLSWLDKQVNLLNVAITRARSSLIIFGDINFCSQVEGLHKLLADYVTSISSSKNRGINSNLSEMEKFFMEKLQQNGFEFECQVPVDNGKYILDFVLKAEDHYVNIELDGRQHLKSRSQDFSRDRRVKELGYEVFRFSNEYVRENIDSIMESLKRICLFH